MATVRLARNTGGRVRALDGVRGIAVLLVTLSHANFPLLKLGAIVGVSLFFVLSGYLITGLLLEELERDGQLRFGRFYLRRAARLLPALLVLVAVYAPLALLVGRKWQEVASGAGVTLLYVNNVAGALGWSTGGLGHCWSLSLEEQFYLLWPAVLLLVWRHARRWLLATIILLAAASLGVRLSYGWGTAAAYHSAYYLPQATAWALLAGAALAAVVRRPRQLTPPRWLASASMAGLLLASSILGMTRGVIHSGLNYPERLAAAPLAAACGVTLIWAVTARPAPAWVTHRLLVWFGGISYGLYLWHDALTSLLRHALGVHGDLVDMAIASGAAVLAVGAAAASRHWVEQPVLNWRDRSTATPTPLMPAGTASAVPTPRPRRNDETTIEKKHGGTGRASQARTQLSVSAAVDDVE